MIYWLTVLKYRRRYSAMSKQMEDLDWAIGQEEDVDITAELDYIYETEERARVARETEHKIAMRQLALKHALVCTLMIQ